MLNRKISNGGYNESMRCLWKRIYSREQRFPRQQQNPAQIPAEPAKDNGTLSKRRYKRDQNLHPVFESFEGAETLAYPCKQVKLFWFFCFFTTSTRIVRVFYFAYIISYQSVTSFI
jgi:hypothetical protein